MLTRTHVVLIHDHPGFSSELKDLMSSWNRIQSIYNFIPVPFPAPSDRHLLSAGKITTTSMLRHATKARAACGQSNHSYLVAFTERRLYEEPGYYQMYSAHWDFPDNLSAFSLRFARDILQTKPDEPPRVFRVVLAHVFRSLAELVGLRCHSVLRGCMMDFDDNDDMGLIFAGVDRGVAVCRQCRSRMQSPARAALLRLIDWTSGLNKLEQLDKEISFRAYERQKRRAADERARRRFDYDVAISYSRSDSEKAESLRKCLKRRGLGVFFDRDEDAQLVASDLHGALVDLFKYRAKQCVLMISRSYSEESWWAKVEMRAALERAACSNEAYIIPIRLDDVDVGDLLPMVKYLDWGHEGIRQICKTITRRVTNAT